MEREFYIYSPYLECKHPRESHELSCPAILLPYPNLKTFQWGDEGIQEEEIFPPEWPSDQWTAIFGCSECGFLYPYTWRDINYGLLPKSTPGRYHTGANCFCVEFRCAHASCKAVIKVHVEKQGATESDILSMFRGPFFMGLLPCGHEIRSVPLSEYKIHKVMGRID